MAAPAIGPTPWKPWTSQHERPCPLPPRLARTPPTYWPRGAAVRRHGGGVLAAVAGPGRAHVALGGSGETRTHRARDRGARAGPEPGARGDARTLPPAGGAPSGGEPRPAGDRHGSPDLPAVGGSRRGDRAGAGAR